MSFDAEPVVDLGVVPFAEQPGVLQRCLSASGPVHEVMDVAPVVRGIAAGEDTVVVADLDRPPQVRGHDPVLAPHIHRLALGGR